MPQLVKPYTYTSGATISSTQVNANEDAIINTLNALDEDNLDPATQIPNSMLEEIQPGIVDAHATDAAEYLTAITPGTTASPSLPDKLTDELERLRYRLLANNNLVSTVYMDSSATQQDAGWVEPPIVGPQLFTNNGFETKTSAVAADAPNGWTLEGTPTSLVITAPGLAVPSAGVNKKALRVTFRTTANEGFKQTLSGLKASTKYLIGVSFAKVSGSPSIRIATTGGLGSGAYQNLATNFSPILTISHIQAVVQTTTAGDPLVVKFINTAAAADVVDFYQVWAYEIKDSTNIGLPHIPMQVANYTTADDAIAGSGAATWTNEPDLSLSQYVPAPGYRLRYSVQLSFASPAVAGSVRKFQYAFRIQQNISGGGATTVEGPYSWTANQQTNNEFIGGTMRMEWVVENPTPGATYAFTTDIFVENDGADEAATLIMNPTIGGGTAIPVSRARLIVERL